MSDSIERVIAEMLAVRAPDFGSPPAREAIYCWATRLQSLRQVPEDEPVAWTIVGPDGKSSIGGWSDMSNHRVMSEIGILRDGHRYAYAYEANPAPPTSDDDSPRDVSWWVRRLKDQEAITDRLAARVAELEATPAQAGAELPERKRSLVNSMVDRFLCWRLPDDFHPDSGVSFTQIDHPHMWPVGTNLLTAAQAKQMVEHMLAGAVPPDTYSEAEGDAYTHGFFDGMDEADTKREPIGHLYRVAHFDEAAARPWASEGTVFVAGPAPIEGRRGAIQYVNVYTADSLARRGGS